MGNLYITGETYGSLSGDSSKGSSDVFLMKYSAEGVLLWQRQYGTNGQDSVSSIAIDNMGTLYLLGRTSGSFSGAKYLGKNDVFLMHLDASGTYLWTRQYGGSGYDQSFNITIDSDDHALFVVNTDGHPYGVANWNDLYKVAADGTTIWTKSVGVKHDMITNIAIDARGSIYLAGHAYVFKSDYRYVASVQALLVKYDNEGKLLWRNTLGSGTQSGVDGLIVTAADDVLISGWTDGDFEGNINRGGEPDLFLGRFDADGQKIWVRQYGSLYTDQVAKITIDKDGYIYMSGQTLGSFDGMPCDETAFGLVMFKTSAEP